MKIVAVDVMIIEAEAPANRARCRPVYCRIHTDEGIYGDGEASVMMMTGAPAAFSMLKDLSGQIIGLDPLDNEVILEKLHRNTYFAINGGPIVQSAFSAIDIALWDIKGKVFNVPVYKLLGGKLYDNLRCYASQINYGWGMLQSDAVTPEEYAARAREAVAQGYDAVKADFFELDAQGYPMSAKARTGILPESYLKVVEARVAAVREAMGDGDIIAECHGYTDTVSAAQIADCIREYRIAYLEEPNMSFYPTVKKLDEQAGMRLAAGERLYSRKDYLPFIQNQALQVLQPDIGNCGGITETRKIADLASVYDIGIQLHCAGSPLCLAASLHLEAVLPNFLIHEHCCVQERDYVRKLAKYDYQPVNGRIAIPELPGIGNELSDYTLSRCEKVTVK